MKKLLSLLFIFILVFTLAACDEPISKELQDDLVSKIVSNIQSEITDELDNDKPAFDTQATKDNTNENVSNIQSTPQSSGTTTENFITKEQAKQIALTDTGLKETQIFDFEIELDRERGAISYEIDFETKTFEYEYDIDAKTGKIINYKKPAQETTATVTKAEAKAIALNHAGLKQADVFELEIELDNENILHYEIDFETKTHEYSYEINATSGKILKNKKEINN